MSEPSPASIKRFADIVIAADLNALPFQHLALCVRRAWFHLKRIDYAHLDRYMQKGAALHEVAKPRDQSVEGLLGLNPDRIDWANQVVYEAKGSAGAQEAVSRQTAFYALMLSARTGTLWRAANDILTQKRTREVTITQELVDELIADALTLAALKSQSAAPVAIPMPLCAKCSYRFLCGYK